MSVSINTIYIFNDLLVQNEQELYKYETNKKLFTKTFLIIKDWPTTLSREEKKDVATYYFMMFVEKIPIIKSSPIITKYMKMDRFSILLMPLVIMLKDTNITDTSISLGKAPLTPILSKDTLTKPPLDRYKILDYYLTFFVTSDDVLEMICDYLISDFDAVMKGLYARLTESCQRRERIKLAKEKLGTRTREKYSTEVCIGELSSISQIFAPYVKYTSEVELELVFLMNTLATISAISKTGVTTICEGNEDKTGIEHAFSNMMKEEFKDYTSIDERYHNDFFALFISSWRADYVSSEYSLIQLPSFILKYIPFVVRNAIETIVNKDIDKVLRHHIKPIRDRALITLLYQYMKTLEYDIYITYKTHEILNILSNATHNWTIFIFAGWYYISSDYGKTWYRTTDAIDIINMYMSTRL